MSGHAKIIAPSSAEQRALCPGSVVMEQGKIDKPSSYASSGTATHKLAEWCLTEGTDAEAYLGRIIEADGFENEVTRERCGRAMQYVNYVRDVVKATGGTMLIEQKLPIGWMTGEEDAEGTADCVVLTTDELILVDLKDGQGFVDVEGNYQLAMYMASALNEHEIVQDFARVRMVIAQPRLDRIAEWSLTRAEFQAWFDEHIPPMVERVKDAMKPETDIADFLNPGEKQCQFCKAKATCPALIRQAGELILNTPAATVADFEDLTAAKAVAPKNAEADIIAALLPHVDLIRTWANAVDSRAEELLHAGIPVGDWKLVEGKRGGRKWTDEERAEEAMKAMRLKAGEMYDRKLISPTTAEKLLKKDSPRRWQKLQSLITQSGGNPTVALASDPRPAIIKTRVADEFDDLSQAAELGDDIA